MKIVRAIFCAGLLASIAPAHAEQNADAPQIEFDRTLAQKALNQKTLSIDDILEIALRNGYDARIAAIDRAQADTAEKQNQSQYAPRLALSYAGTETTDPVTPASAFQGNESTQDVYSASIGKQFNTGTYFEVAGSDTRFDSNAGEGDAANTSGDPAFASLAQPPLHTAALSVTLRQELLRNGFGYNSRRRDRIANIRTAINASRAELVTTEILVDTLIRCWNLALADSSLATADRLLRNTKRVRGITAQKTRLGLADRLENNQWSALVNQAEINLREVRLNRLEQSRTLARSLGIESDLDIQGRLYISDAPPEAIDLEADLAYALANRPDIVNLRRELKVARLEAEIAANERLPSVSLSGTYSGRNQSRTARQAASSEIPRGIYPESRVEFRVEMPLWDEGVAVEARNAALNLKRLEIQESELVHRIRDELRLGEERIRIGHEKLNQAHSSVRQNRAFYAQLLRQYSRGRYSAVAVKNALDALAQSENTHMQARIDYNISRVRYDFIRHRFLERYARSIQKDDSAS